MSCAPMPLPLRLFSTIDSMDSPCPPINDSEAVADDYNASRALPPEAMEAAGHSTRDAGPREDNLRLQSKP